MKTILGVTDGDDGGAVLLVDGRIVAAVNEERLNRMKMSVGFPRLAIREVLRLGGMAPEQVDHVAMAAISEVDYPEPIPNRGLFGRETSLSAIRSEVGSIVARRLGDVRPARAAYRQIKRLMRGPRRRHARQALRDLGISAPMTFHHHHRCHTLAAFAASGFERAVTISLDGGGDGVCSQVWLEGPGQDELLNTLDAFHSIGNFYAYVTHLCGYRAGIHEGKITGLAASGEPRYRDLFRSLIEYRDGQIRNVGRVFHKVAVRKLTALLPQDWEHADLAASIQQHLEEVAVRYVDHWVRASGASHVCLSGGVFANVRLNQRIAELDHVETIYVFPAMGDGGLATGAAFDAWRAQRGTTDPAVSHVPHVYLGPGYTDQQIEAALKSSGVEHRRVDAMEEVIAHLVHEGRVVARFEGAMEYGPRALGHRTIMYHTRDRNVNDWLNKRLNRTEFMPFAPACLAGHEDRLFRWNPASERATRFMTVTLDCSDWMKEHCPAVVHVDGTARPQIVDRETSPSLHGVIEAYHALSGIPAIVNTSFNMHEEPIVCTPDDAVRSYQDGQLDNLAIGSFLLGDPPRQSGEEPRG